MIEGIKTQVLVTGAAGFIGSHLTEELVKKGHHVRAMVRYNSQNSWGWLDTLPKEIMGAVEIYPADVRDPFLVRKSVSGCHIVYHLAALIPIPYSYVAPASYVQTNIMGTLNVLQACLEQEVQRVVHTSTSETYGTAKYTPIGEEHPMVAQSPYAASKIAADKLAESYHLSFQLPVSVIRPFNTFGPRQSARAVIPTIVSQLLSGADKISLGSLSPIRDLSYVKDTVAGFMAIAASEDSIGKVTNIGSSKGISIGELAKAILEICEVSIPIEQDDKRVRPENSEVMQLICDNSRARRTLGWEPVYSLREGLEKTIEWMRSNLRRYKFGIYNM